MQSSRAAAEEDRPPVRAAADVARAGEGEGAARPGASDDPYALDPAAVRDPPARLGQALRQIGPGLILAGSIVGTGELIATTNLGAKVGFALLWLVIFSCLVKVFVQVELARYSISSGRTAMQAFAALPGPGMVLVAWVAAMTLATQFQLGAVVGGVGQALNLTFPSVAPALASLVPGEAGRYLARPENLALPWGALVAVATSALLASGSYRLIETGTTILVVIFTLTTVACVAILPWTHHVDWGQIAGGLVPHVPRDRAVMLAAFAMFGITGVGATELISYPYWCIEKGYARKTGPRPTRDQTSGSGGADTLVEQAWLARARGWLAVLRLDAWVAMAIYTVATVSFYFLGAAVLYTGVTGGLPGNVDQMLKSLASMYAPVLGERGAVAFIVVGAFAVLYSTLFAATPGNARILADALWTGGLAHTAESRRRWVRRMVIVLPLVDLALFAAFGNATRMVVIGGIAQALSLPMVAAAAVFLRYRGTDRRLGPGWAWDACLWASMASFFVAAAFVLFDAVPKLWE